MKWERDPGIVELIEYFDQPGIAPDPSNPNETGWARLANQPKELKIVEQEIIKCRADFPRTARNYFWITTKEMKDIPFRLFESQELIYDKVCWLRDRGLAQKLIITKGRQLGCSTLIEAMIAWRTMFFSNVNALIVSNTPGHASYLFRIMTHIYEMCPWWLRPMVRSHKIEEGLFFENPNSESLRLRPGLNSMIDVQSANQMSGVGQGRRINACHLSEVADWAEHNARQVIEGDLGFALAENVETFAIIETTAKGSGTYFHRLWLKNVEMMEEADWYPLFLPSFFESNRRRTPPPKWEPEDRYCVEIKDRVASEWAICEQCGYTRESMQGPINIQGMECPGCGKGTMEPYIMSDDQLYWFWLKRENAAKDSESLKEFHQEVCLTSEEAFQLSGFQVFKQDEIDFVGLNVRHPMWTGYIDRSGMFHGVDHRPGKDGHCPTDGCAVDHRYDDHVLKVWEEPKQGYEYVIGVDVAEGLGEDSDYSVCAVNKIGKPGEPDVIVAIWRSNTIDPVAFAYPIAYLGRWYNEAVVSIEVNRYDTTFSYVRFQLNYPNLYRWKHIDSTNTNSNKWGWLTTLSSKPRLYQTAKHWLRARMWVVHSAELYEELKTFQKEDYEERGAKSAEGFHDDICMAAFIALYCSHDSDWDDNLQMIPAKKYQSDPSTFSWTMRCHNGHKWGVASPENSHFCRECGTPRIFGERNQIPSFSTTAENVWDEALGVPEEIGVSGPQDWESM